MIKKILILTCLLNISLVAYSKEIPVYITPAKKISTADLRLREGDYVDFKIIEDVEGLKKGAIVTGLVTSLVENDCRGENAELFLEEFYAIQNDKKVDLKGVLYLKGNPHSDIMDFGDAPFVGFIFAFVRGGEVNAFPDKNKYILYLEK